MKSETKSFEAPLWATVDGEWKSLFGSFSGGVSVEWHDFACEETVDWSRSFHPESLELCLNFEGTGTLQSAAQTTSVNPQMVAHYAAKRGRLKADRQAGQRHRFLTIEMSRPWLAAAMSGYEDSLKSEVRGFLDAREKKDSTRGLPLSQSVRRTAEEMLKPPMTGAALPLWYHAKILEIASQTLIDAPKEMFCQRQKRLALDRVEQVKQLLAVDLENPPNLSELGRQTGTSSFHLSRTFTEQTGMTISRYLRDLRLERAAELLRAGGCNVTEAAMSVGYSSLSHFSKAFAQRYGLCPCVFSLNGKKDQ